MSKRRRMICFGAVLETSPIRNTALCIFFFFFYVRLSLHARERNYQGGEDVWAHVGLLPALGIWYTLVSVSRKKKKKNWLAQGLFPMSCANYSP